MKKKIVIMCILTSIFLVSISMASAINTTNKNTQEEESPLYNYRTNKAIQEKIQNIKTKFFGDRLFFLPFQWLRNNNQNLRDNLQEKTQEYGQTCEAQYTCSNQHTYCSWPTECGSPCPTQVLTDNACGCTSWIMTILCGSCTQGIICKTMVNC